MEIIKTIAAGIGVICLAEIGVIVSVVLWYIIRELARKGK